MYFNETKEKRHGSRIDGGKLKKRLHKSLDQLKRHDPSVEVSTEPTNCLFVGNSSVLCGVDPQELRNVFLPYDSECQFMVFPSRRTYSFVTFSNSENAIRAKDELQGLIHPLLTQSHQPFVIEFVLAAPVCELQSVFIPKDLRSVDEYISEDLEQELADFIIKHPRVEPLRHREVLHFGYLFDYDTNTAKVAAQSIPPIMERLIDRFVADGLTKYRPDQVTANIYHPGNGISSHFDTHSAFEDPVISLSLLSDVVMDFKDAANSARIAPVKLCRRSVTLIQGESRYRWKHGIVSRFYDIDPTNCQLVPRKLRVSISFRKIRNEPCDCPYKEFCDWDREGEMSVPATEELARRLEASYVADVYENISSHFDETRHSNWRAVQKFLDSLDRHSVLYDVGCGNGKYLLANDGLLKFGCDMCEGLCSIAAKKGCHVFRADALHLPFREGADAVISIAVLHHMSSEERRKQLIREIVRVLRPGGRGCITVWSMDQSDSEYSKMRQNKDENQSNCSKGAEDTHTRLKVHDGKNFSQQDVFVPWILEDKKETHLRYYHVFRPGELEDLILSVPGCQLNEVVKEQGNYIAFFTKL